MGLVAELLERNVPDPEFAPARKAFEIDGERIVGSVSV
jgi:hypothetical protein